MVKEQNLNLHLSHSLGSVYVTLLHFSYSQRHSQKRILGWFWIYRSFALNFIHIEHLYSASSLRGARLVLFPTI